VHLAAGDSTGGAATHDSAGVAADLDDPATAAWRGPAIDALRGFLERHPQSFARGEMRFRLADLLLVDAREKFRDQMAVYVKAQAEGEAVGPPPVLNQAAALQLYQSILHEDRDFAHLDAVLFNAGMLQADEGSPDAMRYFADLVASHPESRYRQEAYLRMGDMQFNDRAFDACVALYDSAAAGPDPGLQAIALYKMGWAHFNQDRFLQAADAFRSVLDVYGSANRDAIHVSIEPEAEDYLINTLAQAAGPTRSRNHSIASASAPTSVACCWRWASTSGASASTSRRPRSTRWRSRATRSIPTRW
jgi:tetratricopeptide (TPR) repeat protein